MSSTVSRSPRRPAGLRPPGGAFVAGQWVTSGLDDAVLDPEDGAVVGHVAHTSSRDVAAAVGHLVAGQARHWPVWKRRQTFADAASRVRERQEALAALIAAEGVKTLAEARREVDRCAETLTLVASSADALLGETLPFDASARGGERVGWYTREPLGVVGAITPFNDPLNLVAHKLGPALLAGNGVILKPSEHTPLSALALVDVLVTAGVPADRVAVVCGDREVGRAVVSDPRLAAVSFTGGPRTADAITRSAGVKKLLMELGGNNPTVVCADADLDAAVAAVVQGAFGAAGQNCLSVQRTYVHARVFERFVRDVSLGADALTIGSKRAEATDVGPLIEETVARRVESIVDEAARGGATVHSGGQRHGSFYEPTVLSGVPHDSPLLCSELFGPVVVLESWDSTEQVVASANAVGDALQAGVFTASLRTARRLATELRGGAVLVNETSDYRLDAMPFGGFGTTGIGREGVRFAVQELSAPKSVILAG